jgi:hypothetical protein
MPALTSLDLHDRANRRVPLKELPIAPGGALLYDRPQIFPPIPSTDKENLLAVVQALRRRDRVLEQQSKRIVRILQEIRELRRRLRQLSR